VPARAAGASRWWPTRCASWPSARIRGIAGELAQGTATAFGGVNDANRSVRSGSEHVVMALTTMRDIKEGQAVRAGVVRTARARMDEQVVISDGLVDSLRALSEGA